MNIPKGTLIVNETKTNKIVLDGSNEDPVLFTNITASGNVIAANVEADAFITKSDVKFKRNIESLDNCLDKIIALEGKHYNYIHEGDRIHNGYIAQDVQKILPHVVHQNTGGELHIAYAEIIPLLTESVKELYNMVKASKETH
jgi:hypothetical protein